MELAFDKGPVARISHYSRTITKREQAALSVQHPTNFDRYLCSKAIKEAIHVEIEEEINHKNNVITEQKLCLCDVMSLT